MGPEGAIENDPDLRRLAEAAVNDPEGYEFYWLKTVLNERFSPVQAQAAFGGFLEKFPPVEAGSGIVPPMRRIARRDAPFYRTIVPAQPLDLPGAPLPDGARSPAYRAHTREIFAARMDDVRTFGRSALRQSPAAVFSDHQHREQMRYRTYHWFDPLIAAREGETSYYHLPREDAATFDEAIDLTGVFTLGWGHCLLEFAPQFLAIEETGEADPEAPILTDANQPQSHLDVLRYLSGNRRPIVPVAFRAGVSARRMWVASAPEFWPALRAPGEVFQARYSSINPSALAALFDRMTPQDVPPGAEKTGLRKVFLARRGQARRLDNQDEISARFDAAGFTVLCPEDLTFATQLRLAREATHIAGPWGSQLMLALLMGAPSLKVLMFHQPELEERPSITAIAEARGQKVLVVPGRYTKRNGHHIHESRYAVSAKAVEAAMEEWL